MTKRLLADLMPVPVLNEEEGTRNGCFKRCVKSAEKNVKYHFDQQAKNLCTVSTVFEKRIMETAKLPDHKQMFQKS